MAEAGPLIGIVTTRLPSRSSNKNGVIRPALHFCRIAEAAHQSGATVVLFMPDNVAWKKGRVAGWTPIDPNQPRGPWQRTSTKIPDVIYENVYVHLAVNGYSRGIREEAKRRGIPLFNPIMPGKWHMTKLLEGSDCKVYLPPTLRLNDPVDAIAQIREWRTAYIKPSGGYGGNGVTRVEYLGKDIYRVCIDRLHGQSEGIRKLENGAALLLRLRRLKAQPHLVQRTIPLLMVGGRKMDFRVVVHRDGSGEWKVVGIIPKLAAKDGVVTNLVAGGERIGLTQLQRLAALERKRIPVTDLGECAIRIARLLSQRNNHVALAGFDLGVDEQGKTWMIEMNPKPARSLMTKEMHQILAKYQAEFALYLTKQGRRSGSKSKVV